MCTSCFWRDKVSKNRWQPDSEPYFAADKTMYENKGAAEKVIEVQIENIFSVIVLELCNI